ncbi:hypothetical protein N665_0015s0054 [Sinapis alba]|nr:hypothetical protein N665_0015s0054 [Sinapis alba]
MTQGKLVGKEGNHNKREEVARTMTISVPKFDNSNLIEGYSQTLIGRCMNPSQQDMKGVTHHDAENLEDAGQSDRRRFGLGKFQFDFDKEEDIEEVLNSQPYHFDYWMLSLVRWKSVVDRNYTYALTFRFRVLGVPLHYWAITTFESIGQALREVQEVDLDEGRVRIMVDGFQNLFFETSLEFHGGEETMVSLRKDKPKVLREDIDSYSGKRDERSSSYNGVVINGDHEGRYLGRGKIFYHGKGKEKKMVNSDILGLPISTNAL